MIIELTVAMALLSAVGLFLLKSTLDLMAPRQWVIIQNLSDSYLTYEQARAERISFDVLTSDDSPWPISPVTSTETVELGKTPGGAVISGTVIRTRIADTNNLPALGGSGTLTTNPAEMETWKIQSHLTYKIGQDEYYKTRTVVRSR